MIKSRALLIHMKLLKSQPLLYKKKKKGSIHSTPKTLTTWDPLYDIMVMKCC